MPILRYAFELASTDSSDVWLYYDHNYTFSKYCKLGLPWVFENLVALDNGEFHAMDSPDLPSRLRDLGKYIVHASIRQQQQRSVSLGDLEELQDEVEAVSRLLDRPPPCTLKITPFAIPPSGPSEEEVTAMSRFLHIKPDLDAQTQSQLIQSRDEEVDEDIALFEEETRVDDRSEPGGPRMPAQTQDPDYDDDDEANNQSDILDDGDEDENEDEDERRG